MTKKNQFPWKIIFCLAFIGMVGSFVFLNKRFFSKFYNVYGLGVISFIAALVLIIIFTIIFFLKTRNKYTPRTVTEERTKRKDTEIALKESQLRYQSLIDNIPGIVYRCLNDEFFTMLFISDSIRDMCGYSSADFKDNNTRSFISIIHPNDLKVIVDVIKEKINDRVPYEIDYRIRHRDGHYRWVHDKGNAVYDHQTDELLYIDGVIFDITDQRASDERLYQLTQAVEQSPAIVVITDTLGNVEYVNPKFYQVTGYTASEIIGKNLRVLKSGETSQAVYRQLWAVVLDGKEWRGEFHNKKKDGSFYWEQAYIAPIRSERDDVSHYLKIAEDITARKITEQELMRLASFPGLNPNPVIEVDSEGKITYLNPAAQIQFPDLNNVNSTHPFLTEVSSVVMDIRKQKQNYLIREVMLNERVYECGISFLASTHRIRIYMNDITERKRVDEMKSEFVSTVSHELRTPLVGIGGVINNILLGVAGDMNEKIKNYLLMANEDIRRLDRLINDLLDYSRLEKGKLKLYKTKVNITKLVKNVIRTLELQIELKTINVTTDFCDEHVFCYVDGDKITQVFTNLIHNASKFTAEGGNIHISVRQLNETRTVEVTISDTGVGISQENIPKLFKPFVQVDRKDGAGAKGTGLGLAISKGIIEAHKGTIRVESNLNEGSQFLFTLPQWTVEEAFEDILNENIVWAKNNQSTLALVIMKLVYAQDKIKDYDGPDSLKILAAVEVLTKETSRRETDWVMSYNDNRIAIIIRELNKAKALAFIDRLKNNVLEKIHKDLKEKLTNDVKLVFGISSFPFDALTARELIDATEKNRFE
ncbi:MAG: PAS domain S-box protein [Candidatus Omnitrophica bacterium]|nr:PAS domain S-box protein [Candidatus Omnitrophota bacterium]